MVILGKIWDIKGVALAGVFALNGRSFVAMCLAKKQINNWYSKITDLRIVNIKLEHLYGKFDSKTKFIPWLIGELEMNKTLELTECKQKRDFISTFDVVSFILSFK